MSIWAKHEHTRVTIYVLFLLFLLILPGFIAQVESSTSTNKLYAHVETTTIGGVSYYLNKLGSADSAGISLNASAATAGRKLMGRWVYPLSGIVSIPASTWTITYRAMKSASAASVVAHCDVDILIRKSDNTVRTTIATNVANSSSIPYTNNTWVTLTAAYNWPGYTVVDPVDYLEVAYYIEVLTPQNGKWVRLRVDDNTLALTDQTKVENVILGYPNQPPIASFTFSPSTPLVNQTVTFDASASHDPDGSITNYKWDFGDGNITTVATPIIKHVYKTAGSTLYYTVTLTVTDNEGATAVTSQSVPVTNPSILHVSLPSGTYSGTNPDKWLEECWLLNINGNSGTFTLRINDTSAAIASYDNHLIITLNDAAYNNLVSLTVNAVTLPKTAFRNGEPRPYNVFTWPSGDVYPTWFNDTLVNLGTIPTKGYVDATVSVTFSNANGARMHFDAYGSVDPVPPLPSDRNKVTDNPLSEDATVQFFPLAPPLSVSISPTSATIDLGQSVTFTSTVSGGTPPYTFQWYLNSSAVSGATSSSWAFTPTLKGYYLVYLIVTDSVAATAQSNTAQITVNQAPTVSISPTSVTIDVGQSKTFTATPQYGTPGYSYQWYLNGSAVSGATSQTWTFTPSTAAYYLIYCKVTDSVGVTAQSNTATAKVNPSPTVSISPTSVTMYVGQSQSFISSPSGGTQPYTYQWYLNGSAVSGATSSSWTFTSTIQAYYLVYVRITDSVGVTAQSNTATVSVVPKPPGPTVSINPSSVVMDLTQSVTFTSTVSGGTPPYTAYQWYLNGNPVPGATGATWTFTLSSTGSYTVYLIVTDNLGQNGQSNTAPVTVNPPLTVHIELGSIMDVGQSKTLSAIVSGGTPPYTYQWYINGSAVSGATSSSYTFTPTSPGLYIISVTVTDAVGMTASDSVSETVNPALTVTLSPTSAIIDLTQSKTFMATASGGTPPYSYQWYVNGNPVSGATSSSYVFTPIVAGNYVVSVKVTDIAGMSAQPSAPVTVNPFPTVSISPTSYVMDLSQSVTFASVVSGGTTPYTAYQWYLNSAPVPGATSPAWTFTPTSAGSYQVYLNVTDSAGATAKSNVATVTVNLTLAVSITPTSATMDLGQSQLFTSTVSGGSSPYSYQWYLNGAAVSGATSSSWLFSPTSTGSYTVYMNVTDAVGVTKKSNVASVTINTMLTVSVSPSSAAMDLGQSKTFTATASGGTTPYSYKWYLNNALVPGATTFTWTFTPTSTGSYTVYTNVTDSASSPVTKKSNVASVTVNSALTVSISPSPSVTLVVGHSVTFTSTVSGGTLPYSYQWVLNNNPVSGATGATWTFAPTSAGAYSVYLNVTDSGDPTVKSNVVSVTVNPALSVTISPGSASIAPSQSVIFTSAVSGGTTPYTAYQWYLNGAPVPGATLPGWTFTPTSTGTYAVYLSVTDSEIPPVTAQSNTASVIVTSLVGGSVHSITNLDLFESWRSTLLSSIFLISLLLSFAAIKYRRKTAAKKRV
jgi:hypothetical protein